MLIMTSNKIIISIEELKKIIMEKASAKILLGKSPQFEFVKDDSKQLKQINLDEFNKLQISWNETRNTEENVKRG
jgi:hypothetical protein